ncbi:MAG: cupredoxin domain-containing protein [Ignavibacteriaceae bacterium]|jgi:plastocyanin
MKNDKTIFHGKVIPFSVIIWLILVLIYGCGNKNNSDSVRGENDIWIKNLSFIPDSLNIPVGTTVTWINQDSTAYTVTSKDTVNSKILFDSGSILPNDTFNFTFNNSGVYHYYSKKHPGIMQGVIIVQ